jgi:hypothetical protein
VSNSWTCWSCVFLFTVVGCFSFFFFFFFFFLFFFFGFLLNFFCLLFFVVYLFFFFFFFFSSCSSGVNSYIELAPGTHIEFEGVDDEMISGVGVRKRAKGYDIVHEGQSDVGLPEDVESDEGPEQVSMTTQRKVAEDQMKLEQAALRRHDDLKRAKKEKEAATLIAREAELATKLRKQQQRSQSLSQSQVSSTFPTMLDFFVLFSS